MKDKVKFECADCGCYYWVESRNNFECPNCEDKMSNNLADAFYNEDWAYFKKRFGKLPKNHLEAEMIADEGLRK